MATPQLEGKRILVTGASSGIGREAALLFAREGATVIAAARRQAQGESLIAQLREMGCEGSFIRCDIAVPQDVDALFDVIGKRYGGLDGAFNNAAASQDATPLADTPLEVYQAVYDTNVRGTFLCLRHELKMMIRQRAGAIVNTGSIAGMRGYAGLSVYSSSKHAVIGLTRVAALEGAAHGVRVNCVCPGTTRTEMFEQQMRTRPGGEAATVAGIPMGRMSEPREQAAAVAWLLSDQASFVTGDIMVVDGGRTIA
jgi:NAD(P)-dependent dehydrogenase (short-subunit alcohol dehydrogenase family)